MEGAAATGAEVVAVAAAVAINSSSQRSKKHPRDACGEQASNGAAEHGFESKRCQGGALLGSESSDAAELNADGAEIGESAEGKSREKDGAFAEPVGCL